MSQWNVRRKRPYTQIGIRRLSCIRCGKPAVHQWQICSDGNNYRPLCVKCDLDVNALLLTFMRHPKPKQAMQRYIDRLIGKAGV